MVLAGTSKRRTARIWRWGRRAARLIILITVLGTLILGVLAGIIVIYGHRDHAQSADLIVVLGGGTTGTARRTLHAAALYQDGIAPYILCTGATLSGSHITEATICARTAQRAGVPEDAILREEISRSTEENAIQTAAIMRSYAWDSVVIVSDDYHLWRSHLLFEAQGVEAWTSPAQVTIGRLRYSEEAFSVTREVAAVIWYAGKTVLDLPYTRIGQ